MNSYTGNSKRFLGGTAFVVTALASMIASQANAAPGDLLGTINLPVPGFGVSVAANCSGDIFYTNNGDFALCKTDAAGTDLGCVPTLTVAGEPIDIDEIAYDGSRDILWGQIHGSNPVDIVTVNPTTGAVTFAFTSATNSLGSFRDGIAWDSTDDTLFVSGDVSTTVEHYTTAGAPLPTITPKTAAGANLGTISGLQVGVGDLLYLGRDGLTQIVQVQKSDGGFLTSFASPGGTRDEGLECDSYSFAPTLALLSRDVNNFIAAIEIEPGTCSCESIICTLGFWKNHPEEWTDLDPDGVPAWGGGLTYMEIFNTQPKKGDASVLLAHALIAALLNSGADGGDVADAVALLTAHPVGSGDLTAGKHADPDRAVALAVADSLQSFNESAECSL